MNSGSWSSYQAALPPEARAGGEPDDDRPYRRQDRCDGCGKFASRKPGSGSRLDVTPESMFGPERVEMLCPSCAARTPLPPTPEQLRRAEGEAIEADAEYTRAMIAEADAEAAARVGRCDYCGKGLENPRAVGGICKPCEASIYPDVEPFDSDSIPW
jgi:hypothetical protein